MAKVATWQDEDIHTGEMFAGVGGFRLGLEGVPSKDWETTTSSSKRQDSRLSGAISEDVHFQRIDDIHPKQWASMIYDP